MFSAPQMKNGFCKKCINLVFDVFYIEIFIELILRIPHVLMIIKYHIAITTVIVPFNFCLLLVQAQTKVLLAKDNATIPVVIAT